MQAALYLRISQDATGQALGVTRQREDGTTLSHQLGWTIADTYIDNDVSAYARKPRPAYRRMLTDIVDGRIDAIIAWHPDRLYRKLPDLAELIDVAKTHNTQIATVNAGHIDLTTPTGRLVAGLLAQVAVYEVDHKSERWSRSWQQQRERGLPTGTGSRLFGYSRDGQIDPAEAEIARQFAHEVIAGIPISAICRRLRDQGVVGTRNGAWRPHSLRQYLLNPRIAGWSTLKGEIVAEGRWEPILDRATWDTVRALLLSRTAPAPIRRSLLNGLIFCGRCQTRLVTGSGSSRRPGPSRTYRCIDRPGIDGCGRLSGEATAIEAIVEAYAERRLNHSQVRARIAAARAKPVTSHGDLEALERRIAELELQLDEPGVPVGTLLRAIDRAKARQSKLLAALTVATGPALPVRGAAWPEDLQARRGLVELVVARVELAPATKPSRLGFDCDRVQITRR